MDTAELRRESIEESRRLGFEVNVELPLLDFHSRVRDQDEIVRRCLARYVAVAVAYGFDRETAWAWLEREELDGALAPSEREFLAGRADDGPKAGVESLWALCWALSMVGGLDFGQICGDNLISLFPDLKLDSDSASFVADANVRSRDEIVQALDLAYCLHWSVKQAILAGTEPPGSVPGYVVVERRHALEWLTSDDDWDEVSLDT